MILHAVQIKQLIVLHAGKAIGRQRNKIFESGFQRPWCSGTAGEKRSSLGGRGSLDSAPILVSKSSLPNQGGLEPFKEINVIPNRRHAVQLRIAQGRTLEELPGGGQSEAANGHSDHLRNQKVIARIETSHSPECFQILQRLFCSVLVQVHQRRGRKPLGGGAEPNEVITGRNSYNRQNAGAPFRISHRFPDLRQGDVIGLKLVADLAPGERCGRGSSPRRIWRGHRLTPPHQRLTGPHEITRDQVARPDDSPSKFRDGLKDRLRRIAGRGRRRAGVQLSHRQLFSASAQFSKVEPQRIPAVGTMDQQQDGAQAEHQADND
jgi:hypothetical protein